MRVFVAGGTGAIGHFLLPLLVRDGHEVVALTRSAGKAARVEGLGARAAVADALDRDQLTNAVISAKPDVIVHQLTALTGVGKSFRNFDRQFALTNRFRTEVTDTLLAAATLVGARRFIAQSFCGWPFKREGSMVKTEDDPLDPNPPASFRQTLAAIEHLEARVRESGEPEGLALRYGGFYGPGTSIAKDGETVAMVRKRWLPIIGGGAGVWSFLHIADAAGATAAAVSQGAPGIYNVVDDEPAPVSEWLPALARAVGAKPPLRIPAWLGWLFVGRVGVAMMTESRGASNAKAKRELHWQPRYASWRRGFVEGLG